VPALCPNCRTAVSPKASACPRCGHPGPFTAYERAAKAVWAVMLGGIAAAVLLFILAIALQFFGLVSFL
jgi:uncharacterized paraquat-inducible protein A